MGNMPSTREILGYVKDKIKSKVIPGYGDYSGFNQRESAMQEQSANTNAQNAAKELKENYKLNDDQIALLMPLLANSNGRITPEIRNYINELTAAKQEQDYNSYGNQAALMRAAGINPDLNGVEEGGAEIPGTGTIAGGTSGNQDASTGGACKQKAAQITSTLMQAVSLGLNAYGIVAGQIGSAITSGATQAAEDVINIAGNEAGEVEDIQGAINKLVNSKMFRNKAERRAYITEISRRMNAIDVVTKRMQAGTAYNEAKSNFEISKFKATNEYLENAKELIKTKQDIDQAAARYDLEISQRNAQFLVDHPDYTEEKLEYELKNADIRTAKAHASEAESNARVATQTEQDRIDKANAEARSAESKANTDESNEEIIKLRNENEKTVQEFLGEAYKAVYGEESNEIKAMEGRKDLYTPKQTRRKAKRFLREYQGRKKHASASVPGVGSIGFDW